MGLFDSSDTSINIVISAIDQASGVLNTLQGNLQKLKPAFTAMQQLGAAGLAATVAPAIAAVKYYADLGKSTEELSQKTGLSIQGISELGIALDMTGTSTDALGTAIPILAKNLLSAEGGAKAMTKNFQGIGLSVKDLQGLNMDQVFLKVSAAIEKMPQGVQKIAEIKNLFGRGGSNLSSFFDLTPDQLQTYIDLNNKLGDTLSQKDVAGAQGAALAFEELQKAGQGLTILWGETFAPVMVGIATKLISFMQDIKGFVQTHQTLVQNIVIGVAAFSALLVAIGTTGKMLLDTVKIVNFFVGGFQSLLPLIIANPWLLLIPVIVALGVAIYEAYQHSQTFRDIVKDVWGWLQQMWSLISTALQPILTEMWNMIKNLWQSFTDLLKALQPVFDQLKELYDLIAPYLVPIIEVLITIAVAPLIIAFAALVIGIMAAIAIIHAIITIITTLIGWVLNLGSGFYDLQETIAKVWTGIQTNTQAVWKDITDWFQTNVVSWFENAFNSITNTVNSIVTAAQKVSSVVGNAISTVTGGTVKVLGAKASGGWINQTGPYLMHAGEYVIPASQASSGASGGNQSIVVNFSGVIDQRSAQMVGDTIIRKLKMNRKLAY